jgi:hypothetical protein
MRTIERCRNLDVLTQVLAMRPEGTSLRMVRGTKTREHHLVLVAPATVALCALDAGLVGDGRKTLRLLLINAGMLDALDEGQWYRYVPLMLDSRASMQVTANVPDRSVMRESTVRKAVTDRFRIEVRSQEGSLEALLAAVDAKDFDLAVCLQGQGLWRSWQGDGVRKLVLAGVPVYVCEFSPLLAQLGMATAGLWGLEAETAIERNRFALVSKVRGENWAGTIWRCRRARPEWDGVEADERTLATTASQMVLDSHQRGLAEQPFPVGASVTGLRLRDGASAGEGLVHIMDGLVVSPASGRMLQWDAAAEDLSEAGSCDAEWRTLLLERDPDWDGGSRLLWAATVKQCWLTSHRDRVAA